MIYFSSFSATVWLKDDEQIVEIILQIQTKESLDVELIKRWFC